MVTRIATALLFGIALLSPGLSAAEEPRSLEQIVVEMAETPSEHAALAAYYRDRAEKARAEQRRHRVMGRVYGQGKQQSGGPSAHCDRLSKRYGEMAVEYDELAELHEAEAKEAQ